MRIAFVLAVAGPVLAGAIGMAFADLGRMARAIIQLLGVSTSIIALGFVGATVWAEGAAQAASFHAEAWQVLLALGVLLVAVTRRGDEDFEQVCHLAAASAAVGSVLSSDVVAAAAFLIATTAALTLGSWQTGLSRLTLVLPVSDALAVAALVWAAQTGLRVPPSPEVGPALLLMSAGVLRIIGSSGAASGIARVQGFLICAWALAGRPSFAPALMVIASLGAVAFARRASLVGDRVAALSAEALIVIALLAGGTPETRAAAALLVAGTLVAATRSAAGSTMALAATAPGLVGAASVTTATMHDPTTFASGLAITTAAVWVALARLRGPSGPVAVADLFPLGAAAVLIFLPGTLASELGARVAPAFGGGPPLSGLGPAMSNAVGAVFAAALIGVSVVVRPVRPTFARNSATAVHPVRVMPRRWIPALIMLEAAAMGWFFALLILGARRGFL